MHDETDHCKVEKLHNFRTQVMVAVVQHFLLLLKIPWKQRLWTFPLQHRDPRIRKLHLLLENFCFLLPSCCPNPHSISWNRFFPQRRRKFWSGVQIVSGVICDKRWPTADDGCPLFPTLQVNPKERHRESKNFFLLIEELWATRKTSDDRKMCNQKTNLPVAFFSKYWRNFIDILEHPTVGV